MIGCINGRIEEPPKKIQNIMLISNNMLIMDQNSIEAAFTNKGTMLENLSWPKKLLHLNE